MTLQRSIFGVQHGGPSPAEALRIATLVQAIDQLRRAEPTPVNIAKMNALQRLEKIEAQERQYPGRAEGGFGPTGIMSTDTAGYRNLLATRKEKQDIENALAGRPSPRVRSYYTEGSFPSPFIPLPSPMEVMENIHGHGSVEFSALDGLRNINRRGFRSRFNRNF